MKILKVPYIFTKSIQNESYTLSDAYGSCIMLREQLKFLVRKPNKLTNLAECLLNEYQNRRFKMMKNPAMYATVYLDRRYAADLCDGEIELAKMTLCEMWGRVKHSKKRADAVEEHNDANIAVENEDEWSFDMDKYMRSKLSKTTSNITEPAVEASDLAHSNSLVVNYELSEKDFLLSLHDFETKNPIIDSNVDIIDLFEKIQNEFPEIYIVATIFFGIPPSQASVERSFSHFEFVYNKLRGNMKIKLLENILVIRLNKMIAKKILSEEMDELEKKNRRK